MSSFGDWYDKQKQDQAASSNDGGDVESQSFLPDSMSSLSLSSMRSSLEAQMPQQIMGMNYQQRFQFYVWEYYIYGELWNIKRTAGAFNEYVGTGSGSFYCGVFGIYVVHVVLDVYGRWCQGICSGDGGISFAINLLIMVFGDISSGRCNRHEDINAYNVDNSKTAGDELCQVTSSVYRTVRELMQSTLLSTNT
eukprot:scaffold20435_cov127-Skeletonema_dohrnii-CCMP3373.AAC.2